MAGEFTTNFENTHDGVNAAQSTATQTENPGKIETDVPGIFADAMKDDAPVFDVSKDDFFNNLKIDRKRIRLSTEHAKEYHRQTRYRRPFYLRYKDEDGKDGYMRKVK